MGVIFDVLVLFALLAVLYSMRNIWRTSSFSRNYFDWSVKFSIFVLVGFTLFITLFFGQLSYVYLTADEQKRVEIRDGLRDMWKPGGAIDQILSKIRRDQ